MEYQSTSLGAAIVPAEELPVFKAPAIFGSSMRTAMLLLIANLYETYPGELARLLRTSIYSVQRTLDKLIADGLVVSRPLVVQVISLNPRFAAAVELKNLLQKLSQSYPEYERLLTMRRTRPRRRGKAL